MSTRSQNKPPRSPSIKNSRIGDLHLEKRRKVGTGRMVGVANNTGRGRQPFSSVNNRQDAAANAGDLAGTEGSECGTVEFTKEEVEALLNEKFKGKKFDLKGKMEQMNDHIRKLKLCLKWFQEVEEGHIKEKEKLCNTLESAERKCTETEVAMKKMEVELSLLITELTAKTTLLQENLAKEESEKLDAIECQRREKEAKVVAEKLQASLKEELEKAEQEKISANQRVTSLNDMYKRLQEYNTSLQQYNSKLQTDLATTNETLKRVENEKATIVQNLSTIRSHYNALQDQLTASRASQDEAVKQKETLVKEVGCLRGELQQVREDRDRQLTQVQSLTAEIARYRESTGKSVAELDNLTLKSNALEETCSSQREQIRILQHQLAAATEKLKGSCHNSVVPSSASLSARHGPSSTNAALLPSLICEAYWQQCANLGFFLAKSVKPTGSSVRLVEPTTPSLAGLARSLSWFDMNGEHLPLTFRTPPVSPPRPSYLSGMRRVCSLEFRPHLMNSPDTGLADPLLGSGGASGISERSFLPQSTIYNWSCGHFSKPLLTAADDSEEMMARREKNENIDNIAKCQHSSINKLHNQIASWDTKFETGTKTILLQPFNSVVIAADATERIRIWDYEDATLLNSFDNHDYPDKGISKLCLVNELDDSLLLVASCDGNVRIWKDYALKGKQKLVTAFSSIQGHRPGVRSVNAIVDWQQQSGYLYASGEVSSIMIWDLDKEQLVNSVPSLSECSISALSASQVHAGQFVAGFVDGSVRLFDIRTPEMLVCTTWPHTQRVERVVGVGFQPGLDLGKIVSASRAGDIQFLDIRRQKDTYLTIDAHRGSLTALAIHRHAPIIASGSTQQRIKVFNLEGEQLGSIRYYTTFMPQKIGSVSCLTFHPYQVLLAAGAADACVSLYADEISPTKMN